MAGAEGRQVVVYTDHFGLMTDTTTLPDADVPRSLTDLGNPRWRGKVMLFVSTNTYLPWVIRLGKDQTLGALRAAVETRTQNMLEAGLLDEVRDVVARYGGKDLRPLRAIGYRQALAVVRGTQTAGDAQRDIVKEYSAA